MAMGSDFKLSRSERQCVSCHGRRRVLYEDGVRYTVCKNGCAPPRRSRYQPTKKPSATGLLLQHGRHARTMGAS